MRTLPPSRGPRSDALIAALQTRPTGRGPDAGAPDVVDPLGEDDLQLSLYLCYELHYRGLPGVDPRWEWDPALLTFRAQLERSFEVALRLEAEALPAAPRDAGVISQLLDLADIEASPSLSRYLASEAALWEFREFVVHRSLYTLKEADPHSFVLPRLDGAAKAALVEIQADEYGGGDLDRMHSSLYARSMRELDLDDSYGAYLPVAPAPTLATVNLVSMLSLHRRLRGAAMGHLALFELTSARPSHQYGNGLRRLGFGPEATHYYDEHVEADSVHEMIATHDLVGALIEAEPELADDVVFGAQALSLLEERFASYVLNAWGADRSSLLAHPRMVGV